jgi:hypothetical protein
MPRQLINGCLVEGTGKGGWKVSFGQESTPQGRTFKNKRDAVSFAKSVRHSASSSRHEMRTFLAPGALSPNDEQILKQLGDSLSSRARRS